MRINSLSLVMMQLGMATAMVRSAAHAMGVAASGMSSDNLGAKGKGRTSRSRQSSRRAALYCQIKSMLQQDQGVGSGDQSRKTNKLQAIDQVDSRMNAKQYKKVGYKDAKSWMECRLANIKAGVPNWAPTKSCFPMERRAQVPGVGCNNCGDRGHKTSKTVQLMACPKVQIYEPATPRGGILNIRGPT
jgi:hypothetical protein